MSAGGASNAFAILSASECATDFDLFESASTSIVVVSGLPLSNHASLACKLLMESLKKDDIEVSLGRCSYAGTGIDWEEMEETIKSYRGGKV